MALMIIVDKLLPDEMEATATREHSSMKKQTLLLVEDHSIVRESLIELLHRSTNCQVIDSTGDGRVAIDKALSLCPDIILVDFHLGGGVDGEELIKSLRAVSPKSCILVLSAFCHGKRQEEVLRWGADGLIGKSDPPEILFAAIDRVSQSISWPPPHDKNEPEKDPGPLSSLSDRERVILRLFAQGFTVREIAADLGISRKTIEAHRCNIREKLNIDSSDELRAFARRYFGGVSLSNGA